MPALKRFLCSILTMFGLPLLAADSTIGNLTPITVVPDAYRMPWENPGVVDYYITFQNLTNQILSGYQTTNTILSQISVGNGGALTNVPFSIWTNYSAAPLIYTNLNGLAFSPGFGMTSSWTFTNIPGIGPIGIRVNSADTNHFITTDYGGTFTGAVYSVATSQLAPASNQLVTAAFVRNLAAGSGVPYYAGNTVDPVATNATPIGQPVYQFQSTIPPSFNRTYTTADYLTNNGYIGSIVTTNSFQSLQGQILVVAYLAYSGGSASPTLTVHPEIYISYDRTNWTTEFSAGTQNIFYGTTNAYQFLIDIPLTVATNSTGFWIERRFKVDSVTGSGTRTLTFLGGTNAVSGVNDASHITAQSPTATSGNAYLAANQTFTGTNTFEKDALGTTITPIVYLTNATAAALGAQQHSPFIGWFGQGWRSGNSSTMPVGMVMGVVPVQGSSANPTAKLSIQSTISNAAPSEILALTSGGQMDLSTVNASSLWGSVLGFGNVGARSHIRGVVNGDIDFLNSAEDGFTRVHLGKSTADWPAIKVESSTNNPSLSIRTGADGNYASLVASNVTATAGVFANSIISGQVNVTNLNAQTLNVGMITVTNPPVLDLSSSSNYGGTLTSAQVTNALPAVLTNSISGQVNYSTNLSTMAPNFGLSSPYSTITTNAAFAFLAPLNVATTLAETAVIFVTNSTAVAVSATAPANCHSQGTWNVTNVTAFTFFHYGNVFTNAIALPLW